MVAITTSLFKNRTGSIRVVNEKPASLRLLINILIGGIFIKAPNWLGPEYAPIGLKIKF
jgi:hypothetical protein